LITQEGQQPRDSGRLAGAWPTGQHSYATQCTYRGCQLLAICLTRCEPVVVEESVQRSRQAPVIDFWCLRSETALQLKSNQLLLLPIPFEIEQTARQSQRPPTWLVGPMGD
jgi:hypothetical protein